MIENWHLTRLNEVLNYEQPTKYIVENTDYDDKFEIPVLTAGKSFILGYTDETEGVFENLPAIIFDDFTTAFHYVDFPFKVKSSAMKILNCDEDKNCLKFLSYQMSVLKIDTQLHKRYWISKFSKLAFKRPPLETQKRIVQILDDAATLRDTTAQLLKEYDLLAQSIFLEMFGDPVANPKDWPVKKLKNISSKILSGNTPKGGSKVYVEKGIVFFRSQNVWKNNIVLENVAFIDEETHRKMPKSSLKHKDILMTKTGRINTEKSSLGRAAMYEGEDDKANINGHVYLIRLTDSIINEFVLFILTTIQYRDYIRSVCVGGIDKRQINKEHLEEFPIINPPTELQNQFAEKIALIEQQKALAKQELLESEDLFNCLLQKAFKGELL